MKNALKECNSIIWYLIGIILLVVYSLEGTNFHTDFSSAIVSYALLLTALVQFYVLIRDKRTNSGRRATNVERIELILGIVFVILFIYNVTL